MARSSSHTTLASDGSHSPSEEDGKGKDHADDGIPQVQLLPIRAPTGRRLSVLACYLVQFALNVAMNGWMFEMPSAFVPEHLRSALGFPTWVTGVLFSSFTCCQFIGSISAPSLASKHGRLMVLYIATLVYSITTVCVGWSGSLATARPLEVLFLLFLFGTVMSLCAGINMVLSFAVIFERVPGYENRTSGIRLLSYLGGGIFGVVVGGGLYDIGGMYLPYTVAGAFIFADLVLMNWVFGSPLAARRVQRPFSVREIDHSSMMATTPSSHEQEDHDDTSSEADALLGAQESGSLQLSPFLPHAYSEYDSSRFVVSDVPYVLMALLMAGSALGFVQPLLAEHITTMLGLQKSVEVGMVFAVLLTSVMLSSLLVGSHADRGYEWPCLLTALFVLFAAFLLVGPWSLLMGALDKLTYALGFTSWIKRVNVYLRGVWVSLLSSLVCLGAGLALCIVPGLPILIKALRTKTHLDKMQVSNTASMYENASISLGAAIGAFVGGFLVQSVGFSNAAVIYAIVYLSVGCAIHSYFHRYRQTTGGSAMMCSEADDR
ncbi:unnamed protein product [Vitrella brassicaformis CCMP3155]|uniref:Major facilitator superfamily (MFS) profile domain-containing protein n=2 Tax=Vitrella brassicaformis TaxID=1169539 RepID=A0A0G4FQA1_VITBC|nr:unnamed protein product [Vitrella brassicaformis CCMP3155]|eukprot:CEM16460.1 unnamed protein product [Vitrella brassicaformis CCMP3155]